MTEQDKREWFIRFIAKKSKSLYADWFSQKMVLQRLKDQGIQDDEHHGIDELLISARASPEAASSIRDFEKAVDSRIPPSSEFEENQEFVALIQKFGLDHGSVN